MEVPSHGNYTESVSLVHQDSKTSLLKTNNTCNISPLSDYMNVATMAQYFDGNKKRNVPIEDDSRKIFVLKSTESILGSVRRTALIPEVEGICRDIPIVETTEHDVNETVFEKMKDGHVVFLKRQRSSRKCQTYKNACTSRGATSCGAFGWQDPSNPKRDPITVHQVTSEPICVDCYTTSVGVQACAEDKLKCLCSKIINKETLQDCKIKDVKNRINHNPKGQRDTESTFIQTMVYNKNVDKRSISISSPAQSDLEAVEVVFHAHSTGQWHHISSLKNNRLIKLGSICYISNLPGTDYPAEWAIKMQLIKNGNPETTRNDETDEHVILTDVGPLSNYEETKIHPDMQKLCLSSTYKKFEETSLTQTQGEELRNGKTIFLGHKWVNTCIIKEATNRKHSGGWRYPGGTVWIHEIVHSVNTIPCCENSRNDQTCCKNSHPDLRECSTFEEKALFVANGENTKTLSSAEILTKDESGLYSTRQVSIKDKGCIGVPDFPIPNTGSTGAMFNNMPQVCVGYTVGAKSNLCFEFRTDGTWGETITLTKPLGSSVSSVVFNDWNGFETAKWIVPAEGDTEVWAGQPPSKISDTARPDKANYPCVTKISQHEAFVYARPSLAWIFNIQNNTWKELEHTLENRDGPACGVIRTVSGRFVVLAGGFKSSTSEFFNLDSQPSQPWSMGPSLGVDLFGANMVSSGYHDELLLVGGYDTRALADIRRMNSSMKSWETVGKLATPRFHAAVFAAPIRDLPTLC